MPRVPATEPGDALATFHVAKGFRVELVAAEPLVVDPVAMAFDENGRLYVVEMRGYSEQENENLGRVRLLTDDNGDGRFDRSTVFAEGLAWPTAVACYDGGVFVGAAPDILYFKDVDGDGQADRRETVFTGFGTHNVQGLLNSFRWGLDNRIYVAASHCGGVIRRPGEDDPLAVLNRQDMAFNPKTREVDVVTGGGQNGMSFNRWGERFMCSNSDHAQMILAEDRYLRRNPFQAGPDSRRSIAADGPQAAVFRASLVEPWRVIRTQWRVAGLASGPIEGGGTAAGYFTGSTGATIYEGDNWPKSQRGWFIVADVGSNLIHRKRLTRSGVAYIAKRLDQTGEFLVSTDNWFRPVQFRNGPDGALYVADMYREVIEHPDSLPPPLKQRLDLNSGNNRGRIYRIVHKDSVHRPSPAMGTWTAAQLVEALSHRNAWHRRTAGRLIYERQDRSVIPQLRNMIRKSESPEGRLAALAALDGLNAVAEADLLAVTADSHPNVCRYGVRLAEKKPRWSSALATALMSLANDPAAIVGQQVAFTLGEWEDPAAAVALAQLLRDHAADEDVAGAVLTSLVNHGERVEQVLSNDQQFARTSRGKEILAALRNQLQRQSNGETTANVTPIIRRDQEDDAQQRAQLADRQRVYESYRVVLEQSGDPQAGKRVFAKNCAPCHRVEGVGNEIGPNLASMKNRGPDSLLYNILSPNREIDERFQIHTVMLHDGRTLAGIIRDETASSLTFITADAEAKSVLKIDAEQLINTKQSLMPSNFEQQLDQQMMADLLAYLMSTD